MNILTTLFNKIFRSNTNPPPPVFANQPPEESAASRTSGGAHFAPTPSGFSDDPQTVDAIALLTEMAKGKKLNWRESIVDLMKLVGMDSSLENRVALAKELNYKGDFKDSAKMNVWLASQVMDKLTQNGGQIPEDMKH